MLRPRMTRLSALRPCLLAALGTALVAPTLAVAGPPAPASATPPAGPSEDLKAQAAALYKEGAGLFKLGKFKEAAGKFQAAYNLDPSPILLYNLARAAEEQGEAGTAVGHYKAYLARYPQAEDRAEVERRIRVLEAIAKTTVATGSLALVGLPADGTLTIDGAAPPAATPEGTLPLAPGRHVVKHAPVEGAPREFVVEIASGATSTLDFAAEDSGGTSGGGAGRPFRLWGWIGVGLGVAVAGAGTYFYLDSFGAADDFEKYGKKVDALDPASPTYTSDLDKYDRKARDASDRMDSDLLLGRVLLSVGGVAAAAGVTFLIIDGTRTAEPSAAFVPYPGGAGFVTTF